MQYAKAFADIAVAQGAPQTAVKQLVDFGEAFAASPELRNFLGSPAIDTKAKHRVIEKIVARLGAGRIVRNFLFVILDHHRAHMLPEIIAAVQEVVRQRQGIAEAEVSSAVELSTAQKTELAKTLSRLTGKRIEAKYSLDPQLLGGAIARVGDTIYDGSLRSRLMEMRARLAEE
ncbi:MAG: F-type H+-transporting ATPase subunit delta [Acidobacteriaceae bacterium]|jgi:F-type H+-transporting ATPase subunit delta|nr:F-type H+-transporting ATPase subunit delta [Acidobacteriaceae bacterium]